MKKIFKSAFIVIAFTGLVGCSSVPDESANSAADNDYFEGFNRTMWTLNYEYLDPYLVRPVSVAYVDYTPKPVRYGVMNVLANLDEPASFVNNLLMGNVDKAATHFSRFFINSTFGLLGLIDFASKAGISKYDNKAFGDAVGHYGVGDGPYFMVPGYGPYTLRETADTVDGLYAPLTYLNFWASLGKWAFEGMEKRVLLIPQESQLQNSPDPYALTREVHLQRQDFKAEIEKDTYDSQEEDYLDNYLDEDF